MHALATAIESPVSNDDDDILNDINLLVSQIHTSLRLQNSADEHAVAQLDNDEPVVGFVSDTEESDIEDRVFL